MTFAKLWPCMAMGLVLACSGCRGRSGDDAPLGIVADPCQPPLEVPQSILDEQKARMTPGFAGPLPSVPRSDRKLFARRLAERARRDPAALCQYRAADRALAARPPGERRVVFLGDSITMGWGDGDPGLFTHGVVNRGLGTQTTQQLLIRFQPDVVALHPQAVHILAGVNDISGNSGPTTLAAIEDNIVAMVTLARANKIKVALGSVLPSDHLGWAPTVKPAGAIRTLNAWLKAYAAREGLVYVDYYTPLATPEGAMKPGYAIDGVHPNPAGYAVMRPLADQALAELVGK